MLESGKEVEEWEVEEWEVEEWGAEEWEAGEWEVEIARVWAVGLPSSIRRRTYRAMTHWNNDGGKGVCHDELGPP